MPLSNRAPVNAAGQIMVTGTTPTPAWPVLGGMTYDPVTGELAVTSAVPNATDPWVGGLRFTNLGALYIVTTIPSPVFYVGGLPVSTLGQLFMSANPPVGSVGGWPIAGDGGVAGIGSGIGPVPIFWAPLLTTLVPTVAGNPAFTFTRATTAYVSGVAPGGNAVDGEVLILCDANEARFAGARRISANNWSPLYADGSAIPLAKLLGYVAENASTNLCLQSQTFDNAAYWTTQNSVITANDATVAAPDGTITADRFADNATNAFHRIYQSASDANPSTFSVYVKSGTLPWMQLVGNASSFANFNIQTGAVGNKAAGITSTVQALPNGWYRCSMTFVGTAGDTLQICSILTDQNVITPAYVGTGQTMYLWGAQVEQASDPSSYIATTTVAVVRNLDDLRYPWVSNIDGVVGSAYSECYLPASAPSQWQTVFNNTTTGSALTSYHVTLKSLNGPGAFTANVRTLGAVNKGAVAWGGATCSVDLNGGVVATGAYIVANYPNSGSIEIGSINITGFNLQGSIRNVRFYSQRLTDAELIALTGP